MRSDYEEAARLFGAVEALRQQFGYLLEPLPLVEYQEAITNVQKHMDTGVFEAAWLEGQALTEAEAIRFALNYLQSAYALVDMTQATAFQDEKDLIQDRAHAMTRERTPTFHRSGAHSQEPSSKSSRLLIPSHPDGLTRREVEVLRLIAEGRTDAQVAEQLVISPRTVNHHLTSIYRKIQVSSRSAATRYAFRATPCLKVCFMAGDAITLVVLLAYVVVHNFSDLSLKIGKAHCLSCTHAHCVLWHANLLSSRLSYEHEPTSVWDSPACMETRNSRANPSIVQKQPGGGSEAAEGDGNGGRISQTSRRGRR